MLAQRAALKLVAGGVLAGMFVAPVLVGAPAQAAYPPPAAELSLVATPSSPAPGEEVSSTLSQAPAEVDLTIRAEHEAGTVLFDDVVRTDLDGQVDTTFHIPADAHDGDVVMVTVTGDAIADTLMAELVVSDPEFVAAETLAVAGTEVSGLLLLGVAAAALGVITVVVGRRQERCRTGSS